LPERVIAARPALDAAMSHPTYRSNLYGQLAFASVVLTVFVQLTFNERLGGAPWKTVITFLLAAIYTALFSLGRPALDDRPRGLRGYYALQATLVGVMIWLSPSRGFFSIIALPLVSQAVLDYGVRGATPVMLATFVPTVAIWADPYGTGGVLRALLSFIPTYLFAVTFTVITRNAMHARAKSDQLARELASANTQLVAQAEQSAELATTRERNRLAREIHDGVGHYLTTIKVQLDAASALLPTAPAHAAQSIEKASRLAAEALDDVRRSVAALNADASQPPLAESLQRLVADASPTPRFDIEGVARPLSTATEHALYRAAQEGFTNIRKHARATTSSLTLDFRAPNVVRLVVTDNGPGSSSAAASSSSLTSGYGLRGLRERVALLQGKLSAGPRPDGGFQLEVELPA
jgi:signal transduction histidine kinase